VTYAEAPDALPEPPDVTVVNGREPLPWEAGLLALARHEARARELELLKGVTP
jgi:hypothetical protein